MLNISERNKKILYWTVFNIGAYWLLLFANSYGNSGLENIAVFLYWVLSISGTILIFFGDIIAKKIVEEEPDYETTPLPNYIDVGFDVVVLMTLVYFGYNVLGIFFLLHIIGANIFKTSIKKYKSKKDQNSTD